jgi:ferredoxin-NADP reductase
MFAMLYYKDPSTGQEIGRAFSISSSPSSNYFEFMIAMVHGQMTSKLEVAKPGDVYWISAPYGQFKFDINSGERFLFIAGGTGIAPFFSMFRYAKSLGKKMDACMICSVKYPYEVIKTDDLDAMISEGLKLSVTVTRPQPEDNWKGLTGHIDANMIKNCVPDFVGRDCYICGPPAFVSALKQAVMSLGVSEKAIKAEMWGE